jgi:hypothetical protein
MVTVRVKVHGRQVLHASAFGPLDRSVERALGRVGPIHVRHTDAPHWTPAPLLAAAPRGPRFGAVTAPATGSVSWTAAAACNAAVVSCTGADSGRAPPGPAR